MGGAGVAGGDRLRIAAVIAAAVVIVAAVSYRVWAPADMPPEAPAGDTSASGRGEGGTGDRAGGSAKDGASDAAPAAVPADLVARIGNLVRTSSGRTQRDAATLLCRFAYAAWAGERYASEASRAIADAGKLLAGGTVPFEPGVQIRGYYAANDDSCQPFSLSLPEKYEASSEYPLLVFLHHHGWTDWYRPFQGHPAPEVPGFIVAAPHGRGSCDYMWIAEDDVLAVMDAVAADLRVDRSRVYVTGWSMGGTGSWNLACRYPDRFAAAYPVAGNTDFTAWLEAWREDRPQVESPYSEVRWWLRWNTAPVTFAENLLNVHVTCEHGREDAINPIGHSRSMAGRLRRLGYANVRYQEGEGGHGWGAAIEERVRWMRNFRVDPWPERVRYKTAFYRWNGAYWVRIERFERRLKFAEIDAACVEPGRIEVRTDNVRRFSLSPGGKIAPADRPLTVTVDGAALTVPPPLPPSAAFEKTGTPPAWSIARGEEARPDFPPLKRKGLEGPCDDLFRDPFLIVVGTTAEDPFERWIIREEAERWRRQWLRRFVCLPPAKDDREVTDGDIRSKNLVLFGGPHANSICAQVMGRLPVRMEGKSVVAGADRYEGDDIGMKVCYPNPLNPDRLVFIQAATTWKGMWQMTHRFGNWFDWMPLDNRDWFDYCVFDDRSEEFETF
ncbi:MAG: alpha/beta fold hydrolase, partial [Planctomycetota bacterium]|nr:alpha/beta fold hydrolase [Planctomycetota bacterium]